MDPADVSAGHPDLGRYSTRRKTQVVIRLLRGEAIDALSRELGVTAATVSGWRDHLLAGGQSVLKTRQPDAREEEVHRLKAKIGDQAMEIELLREKQRRLKQNLPLACWRSRT
jgi:predicted RNase H-like nuclease (RuvC/YqgF family)